MVFVEYLGLSLVGGVLLIGFSKGILAKLIQRKPDYYQDGGDKHE